MSGLVMPTRILIVGSGAREHALAWKLSVEPGVNTVFVAPGNDAMAAEPRVRPARVGVRAACEQRTQRLDRLEAGEGGVHERRPAERAAGIAEAPRAGRMITAALLDRAGFDRVGPFDEEARVADQLDWVGRAVDAGLRFGRIDDVVVLRRSHSANTTRERRDEYGEYARVLKQIIDRRRGRA